jgi:nicotinate phosphoribosyltransferase
LNGKAERAREFQRPGGLLIDLYHLDSAYVSWATGRNPVCTFDLYTRDHPFGGEFLLVAGLALAAQQCIDFDFTSDEIDFLRTLRPSYDEGFFHILRNQRFTGDVWAMTEGEIGFAREPVLRVTAPFQESLLLESILLHLVGVSTLLATKAARIVRAATGRPVADFGFRRAQQAWLAARSAYLGGCQSTSFLSAAFAFDIPASGTIPHALVELFPTEDEAFRAVAESLDRFSFLLDTYDVHEAIETAISIARDVGPRLGHQLASVRLDSGDLDGDSWHVRRRLDQAGFHEVRILASGNLDEWRISELVQAGAPIDGFGVGTSLAVGSGSAAYGAEGGALGAVYKLAWIEHERPPIKLAGAKSTWPGIKQVARVGSFDYDIIQLADEQIPAGAKPLLHRVVHRGAIVPAGVDSLGQARKRAAENLAALPGMYQELASPSEYRLSYSQKLMETRDDAARYFESL